MRDYEFVIYDADGSEVDHQFLEFVETASAKSKAGRIAKKFGGPVDLAFAAPGKDWEERYITTANPSEFHSAGFRFERIA